MRIVVMGMSAVLMLSGCGSYPQPPPVIVAPSITQHPVIDDATADAALEYYMSPERQTRINAILDGLGKKVARALITGQVPTQPVGHSNAKSSYDGFDTLHTSDKVIGERVSVELRYVQGQPTLNEGVLTLAVKKYDVLYVLKGNRTTNGRGIVSQNTPQSWSWKRTDSVAGAELNTAIKFRDEPGVPNWNTPLDPSKRYAVYLGLSPATKQQLRSADDSFFDTLTALDIGLTDLAR